VHIFTPPQQQPTERTKPIIDKPSGQALYDRPFSDEEVISASNKGGKDSNKTYHARSEHTHFCL